MSNEGAVTMRVSLLHRLFASGEIFLAFLKLEIVDVS
jgi:hypothetical protein